MVHVVESLQVLGERGGCVGIKHRQQGYWEPLGSQLLRHFERGETAKRPTREKVGTLRLNLAYRLEVQRSHVLDARQGCLPFFQATLLQSIEGLIRAQRGGKVRVTENSASSRMHAKNGGSHA